MAQKRGEIVVTQIVNGSKNGEDEGETKPCKKDVGNGICGDGDRVGDVAAVIVACSSGTDASDGAVDTVL